MIDVESMKKNAWVLFLVASFFGLFGPSGLSYYWWFYSVFFVLFFAWTLYLIYGCERYVLFLATMILVGVAIFSFLASSLAYVSVSSYTAGANMISIVGGLAPILAVGAVLAIILLTKPSYFPFECKGNRVTVRRKEPGKKNYRIGLIAGASTLTGGIFLKSVDALTSNVVAIVGCTGCSIAILILLRHSIRGLRTLQVQERSMSTPYTFMQIDEIREARSRWWLGRLFKRLASPRHSPGA